MCSDLTGEVEFELVCSYMATDDSSPAETSGEVIGDKSIDGFVFLLFLSICKIYAIQFISEVLLVESDIFLLI